MFGTPINPGSREDKASIDLATKQGRWIKNVRKMERSPQSMQVAEQYMHKNCPDIETRSLSSSYNCVGMVVASRRVVVEPDELPKILSDDEYRLVRERSKLKVGDLVIYKKSRTSNEIDHIGVIIGLEKFPQTAEIKIRVLSQWGFDGEYIHDELNVPSLYGKHLEYYSERKS